MRNPSYSYKKCIKNTKKGDVVMSLALFKRDPLKLFENVFHDNVSPFVSSLAALSFKVDIGEDDTAIFI